MSWNAIAVRNVDKQPSGHEVDCPGGEQTCPNENTCCKLSDGSYGCCRLPEVVFLS